MLFRAKQHGSRFDLKLFRRVSKYEDGVFSRRMSPANRTKCFVAKLLRAIEDCFTVLRDNQAARAEDMPSTLLAYQFLSMVEKVLPSDLDKLQRVVLTKTIPRLLEMSQLLEETTECPLTDKAAIERKLKVLEKKVQPNVRELLLTKLITDFKLQFHLATGTSSSASVRTVTEKLLPLALAMHSMAQGRLLIAQHHLILRKVL